jgi:hypothetical protein
MAVKPVRGIEVKGARELGRALKKGHPELLKRLKTENKALAGLVADTARGEVPRRSGRLAASIRPGVTQKSGVVRAGTKAVPYAGPIHFGWFKRKAPAVGGPIRPNPFLYRALDARRDEVYDRYLKAVNEITDEINRSTP